MGAPGSRFPTFSRLLSVYGAEIKTTGGFLFTSSSYSRSEGIGQACKVHKRVSLSHCTLYSRYYTQNSPASPQASSRATSQQKRITGWVVTSPYLSPKNLQIRLLRLPQNGRSSQKTLLMHH